MNDEMQGPASPQQNRCIWIVDDHADSADLLAILLQQRGYQVEVAYDGPRAIEMAATTCPHAVVLDIGMSRMDGYELARRLRALPGFESVLLVALTGWGREQDVHDARQAGLDHHLTKPADVEVLDALLSGLWK